MSATPRTDAQEKSAPTVEICYPQFSYSQSFASLRQIDLKNFDVMTFDENGKPDLKAHLRAGKYEARSEGTRYWLGLKWFKVPHKEPNEPETAVAQFDLVVTSGSASDYGVVQVFRLDDGHLKVVQQILFNTRGNAKVGAMLDAKSNTLTIRGVHGWDHCCPTQLDIVRHRLESDVFNRVANHREPLQ
jgi:hypothetical protein